MKILGSDYDGTFTHGGVGDEKLAAIRAWREAGNKFGIISGRAPDFLERLKEKHSGITLDFFASCNGGYITDGDGQLLYEAPSAEVSLKELSAFLLSIGCRYVHVVGTRCLCVVLRSSDAPPEVAEDRITRLSDMPDLPFFYQVSVRLDTVEAAAVTVEQIRRAYGEAINPLQNGRAIDIVAHGVNKAYGLYRMMEHYGAAHGDVIAVGDNINDIDMIRAFRSYAMENGVPEIKALANATVADVTELLKQEL